MELALWIIAVCLLARYFHHVLALLFVTMVVGACLSVVGGAIWLVVWLFSLP